MPTPGLICLNCSLFVSVCPGLADLFVKYKPGSFYPVFFQLRKVTHLCSSLPCTHVLLLPPSWLACGSQLLFLSHCICLGFDSAPTCHMGPRPRGGSDWNLLSAADLPGLPPFPKAFPPPSHQHHRGLFALHSPVGRPLRLLQGCRHRPERRCSLDSADDDCAFLRPVALCLPDAGRPKEVPTIQVGGQTVSLWRRARPGFAQQRAGTGQTWPRALGR